MATTDRSKTIRNLNKEITFMGLPAGFWLVFTTVLLLAIIVMKIWFLIVIPFLLYGATKLEKLQKESTPNFIKGITDFKTLKKTYHDKRNVFKYL